MLKNSEQRNEQKTEYISNSIWFDFECIQLARYWFPGERENERNKIT